MGTPDKDDIAQRVKRVIAGILPSVSDGEVKDEHSLRDDLGADSLDEVEITMDLETEFGIEITDAECDGALIVSDFIRLVKGKVT